MAVAVVKKDDQILIRKFDPSKNPYQEPWGLFGGRLEGDGDVTDALNHELQERWNMTVNIDKRIGWDQEQKIDHDDEEKRFIYLDALCNLETGDPQSTNPNEELKWVNVAELHNYELNPPSAKLPGSQNDCIITRSYLTSRGYMRTKRIIGQPAVTPDTERTNGGRTRTRNTQLPLAQFLH